MEANMESDILIFDKNADQTQWAYWRKPWILWVVYSVLAAYLLTIFSLLGVWTPLMSALLKPFLNVQWAFRVPLYAIMESVITGLILGVLIGAAQWLVLRNYITEARRWIWLTMLATALGQLLRILALGGLLSIEAVQSGPLASLFAWIMQPNPMFGVSVRLIVTLSLISILTTVLVQMRELYVWFYNTYPWLLAAIAAWAVNWIVAVLITQFLFTRQLYQYGPVADLTSSLLSVVISGYGMMYLLQREYEIEADERGNGDENDDNELSGDESTEME